jgi:hypothetical protein
MRYVDEYRNEAEATRFVQALEGVVTRPWSLMEICGGQTHTLMKSGIDQMFPESVTMIHGPGCPVCVTPLELIDRALVIARRPEVIFTSFGDMLRVPGSTTDLLSVKSEGGDVRIVYSPLERSRTRTVKSYSLPSDSRLRHRPTPWRCGGPTSWGWRTSPFSALMSWCPRQWRLSSAPPTTGFTAFWRQGTCAL